ncbi:hypothetical protein LYSHEL_01920 [Lysobacter helvus]|uniref:HTH cro/C1-type domain-containing protein n=2 Tax=Lysobacteraceae TaxID=32033 RepID=A0ABN6FTX3_9GAMM|nr:MULTISPECIES: helix-turn-helix transcriptional regulator [Lysobacter]BCT91168.1 hypothetical protein LYSCAS_01920 [Lysobacter caseinilyticus]BCT94321.1 hypothetical protein LYSHEL_01920 [Lysobacter helvus]
MAASKLVVQAIRDRLRERGLTYRELATRLGVSEVTVKRDLGRGDFSLARLDAICEALGVELVDLLQGEPDASILTVLDDAQEHALVSDPKLLLATYLIVNDWKFAEILAAFRVDENELVSLLLRLDQLRIIDYRPPKRFTKRTARNFAWQPGGPVHAFFLQRVVPEFFGGAFDQGGDAFHFMGGTLSDAAMRHVAAGMARLAREFDELVRRDTQLPLEARHGCSAVFALRRWEFSAFTALRRGTDARE